jgi:hypothetical protein
VSKTFIEKFGKSPDRMDEGEWKMAQFSLFSEVFDRLDITNGSVKEIPKIKGRVTKMWIAGGIYGTGILVGLIWLFEAFMKHCGF